jgi:hypothetical protein
MQDMFTYKEFLSSFDPYPVITTCLFKSHFNVSSHFFSNFQMVFFQSSVFIPCRVVVFMTLHTWTAQQHNLKESGDVYTPPQYRRYARVNSIPTPYEQHITTYQYPHRDNRMQRVGFHILTNTL